MVNCNYNSLRSFSSDRSYTLNRSSFARDSMTIEELLVPSKEQVCVLLSNLLPSLNFHLYDGITFFVAWQKLCFCMFGFAFISLPVLPVKEKINCTINRNIPLFCISISSHKEELRKVLGKAWIPFSFLGQILQFLKETVKGIPWAPSG